MSNDNSKTRARCETKKLCLYFPQELADDLEKEFRTYSEFTNLSDYTVAALRYFLEVLNDRVISEIRMELRSHREWAQEHEVPEEPVVIKSKYAERTKKVQPTVPIGLFKAYEKASFDTMCMKPEQLMDYAVEYYHDQIVKRRTGGDAFFQDLGTYIGDNMVPRGPAVSFVNKDES